MKSVCLISADQNTMNILKNDTHWEKISFDAKMRSASKMLAQQMSSVLKNTENNQFMNLKKKKVWATDN